MRHIPSWFPGAGFKRAAKKVNVHSVRMAEIPFNIVKERKVNPLSRYHTTVNLQYVYQRNGDPTSSFVSEWLDEAALIVDEKERSEFERDVRDVAIMSYAAGFETVSSQRGMHIFG